MLKTIDGISVYESNAYKFDFLNRKQKNQMLSYNLTN